MPGLSSGTRNVSHLKEYLGESLSFLIRWLQKAKTDCPELGSNPWPAAHEASTLPLRHTHMFKFAKFSLVCFGRISLSQSNQIVSQKSSSSPSQPIKSNCLPKIIIITLSANHIKLSPGSKIVPETHYSARLLLPQRANYGKSESFQLQNWMRQRGFSAWGIQTGPFVAH